MYDFAYHKPTSLADAVKLLADPDAKAVSGGHTLIPALKHRLNKPSALVDLSGIAEMRGIRREGNAIIARARIQAVHQFFAVRNDGVRKPLRRFGCGAGHFEADDTFCGVKADLDFAGR